MDQTCRWVIKYFFAYLAMLWSNLDHAVVTAAIRQWVASSFVSLCAG